MINSAIASRDIALKKAMFEVREVGNRSATAKTRRNFVERLSERYEGKSEGLRCVHLAREHPFI